MILTWIAAAKGKAFWVGPVTIWLYALFGRASATVFRGVVQGKVSVVRQAYAPEPLKRRAQAPLQQLRTFAN